MKTLLCICGNPIPKPINEPTSLLKYGIYKKNLMESGSEKEVQLCSICSMKVRKFLLILSKDNKSKSFEKDVYETIGNYEE